MTGGHPGKQARLAAWHRAVAGQTTGASRAEHLAAAERIESRLRIQGRCSRCGRTLTDPVSVAEGLGRDCATRLAAR